MDYEYLSKRHREELLRADEAESVTARNAHLALARKYLAEIERTRSSCDDPDFGIAPSA